MPAAKSSIFGLLGKFPQGGMYFAVAAAWKIGLPFGIRVMSESQETTGGSSDQPKKSLSPLEKIRAAAAAKAAAGGAATSAGSPGSEAKQQSAGEASQSS